MSSDKKVRFIRKNGRIVPIRDDGGTPNRDSGIKRPSPVKPQRATKQGDRKYRFAAASGAVSYVGYKTATGHALDQATGNIRAYHGTSKSSAASIRKTGLQTKFGNSDKSLFKGKIYERNKGLTFVSRDKRATKRYANAAEHAKSLGGVKDGIEWQKASLDAHLKGVKGEMLEFNIPASRFKKKFFEDPENALLRERGMGGTVQASSELRNRYATKNNISRRRIKGALGWKTESRLKLRNMKKHLTRNTGEALRGYGKVALGVGLAAAGAYGVYHSLKKKKQQNQSGV